MVTIGVNSVFPSVMESPQSPIAFGSSPMRVLLVEDVLSDAQLTEFELRRSWPDLHLHRVDGREDFVAALETFLPDLIVSDFHLPSFDGMEALRIAREIAGTIPFIIVTGALSEEVAAECIKAGADDYVLKDRLQRLASSIHSAMEKSRMLDAQRNMEKALRDNEMKYRTLFENAKDGYLLLQDSACLDCNSKALEVYGRTREEMMEPGVMPYMFSPTFQEDGRTSVEAGKAYVAATLLGQDQNFEWVHSRPDGTLFFAEITLVRVLLHDHPHIICFVHDITQRKRSEAELRRSERKYRDIVKYAPVGIYQSSPTGEFLSVNNTLSRILGYDSVEDLMQVTLDQDIYVEPEDRKSLMDKYAQDDFVFSAELRWKQKSGNIIWVNLAVHAVRSEYGIVQYFEGFVRDVTLNKLQNIELIKAKELAEQSDKLKDAFIANMSHEIRTPLNSISGFSELLHDELEQILTPAQEQYFASIKRSSNRLTRTVDHILGISSLQAGTYELHPVKFDIVGLVRRLVFDLAMVARTKGLELIYETNVDSLDLMLDQYSIEQSVMNLIDNAIKFTKIGSIQVTIDRSPSELRIIVQDTGIGISEEYLPRLFSLFSQEELGYTRSFEGLGLGLAITKMYVDLNGGHLEVASEKGAGAIFTIFLPISE